MEVMGYALGCPECVDAREKIRKIVPFPFIEFNNRPWAPGPLATWIWFLILTNLACLYLWDMFITGSSFYSAFTGLGFTGFLGTLLFAFHAYRFGRYLIGLPLYGFIDRKKQEHFHLKKPNKRLPINGVSRLAWRSIPNHGQIDLELLNNPQHFQIDRFIQTFLGGFFRRSKLFIVDHSVGNDYIFEVVSRYYNLVRYDSPTDSFILRDDRHLLVYVKGMNFMFTKMFEPLARVHAFDDVHGLWKMAEGRAEVSFAKLKCAETALRQIMTEVLNMSLSKKNMRSQVAQKLRENLETYIGQYLFDIGTRDPNDIFIMVTGCATGVDGFFPSEDIATETGKLYRRLCRRMGVNIPDEENTSTEAAA